MFSKAQGTIEYLVVIAVIVVFSLVVVGLMSSTFGGPASTVNITSSKLNSSLGSGGISVVDSVVDVSGNGVISLKNTSGGPVTVTSVVSGGSISSYSRSVSSGGSARVFVDSAVSSCACSAGDTVKVCEYTINYVTADGLAKSTTYSASVNCVNDAEGDGGVDGLGSGTLADPWVINSCAELQDINSRLDGNYALGADIDCSGTVNWNDGNGFSPIGLSYTALPFYYSCNPFTGDFDGRGHKITGLFIFLASNGSPYINCSGIFGTTSGTIRNVGIINQNITGSNSVGALAGFSSGTISNSYSSGKVVGVGTDAGGVGGLVGTNSGIISGSYTNGETIGVAYVGGLVGWSDGNIDNSYSSAVVSSAGGSRIGGLVGSIEYPGGVIHSYTTGDVNGYYYVGGLAGRSLSGFVYSSYSSSDVNGYSSTGGLVGEASSAEIKNSFSTGDINGTLDTGGLVGLNYLSSVRSSFSTGDVNGTTNSGGLAGTNYANTIYNSFAVGRVSGVSVKGGLIGANSGGGATSNTYWDISRTNQSSCCGSGTCSTCTGKNSADSDASAFFPVAALGGDYNVPMQHNSSSSNDWDFDSIWNKVSGSYPSLK